MVRTRKAGAPFLRKVMPERTSVKLSSLLRGKGLYSLAEEFVQVSRLVRATISSSFFSSFQFRSNPSFLQRNPLASSLEHRNVGCASIMPAFVEAESIKHAFGGKESQNSLLMFGHVPAQNLDRELLRERCTQPLSDRSWMQGLGVGLFRDQPRNYRSLSTSVSGSLEERTLESCAVSQISAKGVSIEDEKVEPRPVSDDGEDVETDSDDENEEQGELDTLKPGMPSIAMEESLEALEASLKEMEESGDARDPRIGATCLRLAQLCDSMDEDPDKILEYGRRALKILASSAVSAETAMCHQVIGSAYFKMDESEQAVDELERSAMIIQKLETTVKEREIGTLKSAVQVLLGHAKMSLGRHDEALINFHEGVAVNERILEPGNPDLARCYQQVAEALMEADDPEEALCMCMKALPIYTNYYGANSLQVAVVRRLMSVIHNHNEEYEKVLSEHKIVRPILENLGKSKEVIAVDLASGEALLCLERFKEGIPTLQNVVKQSKENSRYHGHALVLLGKAHAGLNEGKDAAKYCKKALGNLKSKSSLEAGASLVELASVYQTLNEQEQAMAALKRALEIFQEDPDQQEATADIEGQIGLLFMFMSKANEGLPYLERSASKLEEIYGPESVELLAVYNHIAIANLELGKLDDALDKFEEARVIATESHGSDDPDTIAIYHNLVSTYSGLARFDKAIECQKHIVESKKKIGSESADSLEEAEKKLKELLEEKRSSGSSSKSPNRAKHTAKR